MEHSKQAFSVMFSGNAVGRFFPPMVVYKAKNVYVDWTTGGPADVVYDATPSGWFDTATFERWFFEVFLKHAKLIEGVKVLIGDKLSSHFSSRVIEACLENNIKFVTLIPNSTHICQPLDVAVFKPLKFVWKTVLEQWRNESRIKAEIPKSVLPSLQQRLWRNLNSDHLIAGFRASGIYPLDEMQVLKRLPGGNKESDNTGNVTILNESCIKLLKENLGVGAEKTPTRKRGRKVTPGAAITTLDGTLIGSASNDVAKTAKTKRAKKNTRPVDDVSSTNDAEGDFSLNSEDDAHNNEGENLEKIGEIWTCVYCLEEWEEDDNVWIVCDAIHPIISNAAVFSTKLKSITTLI